VEHILWFRFILHIFLTYCSLFSVNESPDDQEDVSSWDTWFLDSDITHTCIRQYYETDAGREENVAIMEKGTIESDYEDDDN
jgi:hypothetical protein